MSRRNPVRGNNKEERQEQEQYTIQMYELFKLNFFASGFLFILFFAEEWKRKVECVGASLDEVFFCRHQMTGKKSSATLKLIREKERVEHEVKKKTFDATKNKNCAGIVPFL